MTGGDAPAADPGRLASAPTGGDRPLAARLALRALLAAAFLVFVALGTWQVERRAWKLDLMQRVDARIHAAPGPAPGPAAWPQLQPADAEYRHVRVSGVYRTGASTAVQAVTEFGPGFWLLTPLRRSDDGSTVLVNRGFVVDARSAAAEAGDPPRPVVVTGLLRLSEPGGGFLRRNDPATDRWHSRDVPAIAAARRLAAPVAPYFIDADADADASPAAALAAGRPVGGLTVVRFRNNHLVYALTWYALAVGVVVAACQSRERAPARRRSR